MRLISKTSKLIQNRFLTLLALVMLGTATVGCAAIEGRQTVGQSIDDATISTKVRTAIMDEPGITLTQIDVETMQGVVQLSGFVDSVSGKTRAENVARKVEGVKGVKNSLVVR